MRMPRARSTPTNLSIDGIDLQRSATGPETVLEDHDSSNPLGFSSIDLSGQDLDFTTVADSNTPTSAVS